MTKWPHRPDHGPGNDPNQRRTRPGILRCRAWCVRPSASVMPTVVGIAIVRIIIKMISLLASVFAQLPVIAPVMPVMAAVPVTVAIAECHIAGSDTDANADTADMHSDADALGVGGNRYRQNCAG